MSSSFVWDRDVYSGGFVHGQRYTLDPASQHVPLNATQRALRPPRPIVPANYATFIGLPSYRDGNRCGFTLFTALSRASRPESLVIGVVDQTRAGDVACVDAYCKLAAAHWPTDTTCRYQDRIRVDARDAAASTGPIAARTRHICYFAHAALSTVPDFGAILLDNSSTPQLGAFIGAGFQFSKCHAQTRVPLDARLRWVFLGEEFLRSMQLWTHGYDIYSPSRQGHVVFHDESHRGHNGSFDENVLDPDAHDTERDLSMNRVRQQLHLPVLGAADETDVETYYPKDLVRSVDAYLAFAGVSNTDLAKDHWPCDQLHWVPYTNPEPIQALVPGYEMADMQRKNDAASVCLVAGVVVVALAAVVGGCVRRCRRQAVAYTRVATEGEDDTCELERA
ncbi:hypothetical protein SPRG_22341 [Saprolegnia parasitica CBS 223.65]|uniref:Uncharacterized protein n=1 Tax=Saprolegnia parasitica (strain CBS 223.65) TaxID=695850 RepID=A0A067BZQ4_SAPPC|nr:hypothetical protein SPRG_22341 [Saprolegnia parasitica CBS 223.65]KDO20052.1 hypothetical protein SPRG_22341 [Saprolegnia parasitica CBS 223.65]|eukprot:XP_012209242.1 hypothetical protein SPRG_22341 [Saprolegnia parasitica CBS 223.65]